MFGVVQIEWYSVIICALALGIGVFVARRLKEPSVGRLLLYAGLCVVPGLLWAAMQIATLNFFGRVREGPAGAGFILFATVVAGLRLVSLGEKAFMARPNRGAVVAAFLALCAAWLVGAGVEVVSVVAI